MRTSRTPGKLFAIFGYCVLGRRQRRLDSFILEASVLRGELIDIIAIFHTVTVPTRSAFFLRSDWALTDLRAVISPRFYVVSTD